MNAGSMADIAFLLLIFFLVTTTIAEEKGVLVRLPEWTNEEIKQQIPDDDVLLVIVNKEDKLMVENEEVALSRVPALLQEHIRVPGIDPRTRVVSLTHDRSTSYARYLEVYDALKSGYHVLWDGEAKKLYGVTYDFLSEAEQSAIRKAIPVVISEAEPTEV